MENVAAFNSELSGLYDSKPPISKAKMASITKAAMRAIKFYKHVVQSVEKFILKCKPEYKVPGLYVIDSIVRQSRQQFGNEKDVFAPRFARNIKETFANLFRCAPEDKSRIIRVLNLWQKNNVFAPEVIQPIFDLADPNHPVYQLPPGGAVGGPSSSGGIGDISSSSANGGGLDVSCSSSSGVGDDKLGNLQELSSLSHEKAQSVLDNSTLRQLEHMQQYLKRQAAQTASGSSANTSKSIRDTHGGSSHIIGGGSTTRIHHPETYSKYTKGAHDIVYHERDLNANDDDDDALGAISSPKHSSKKLLDNNNLQQLLNDPNVLRQLQTLQSLQKIKHQEEKQLKMNEMRLQEEAFEKHVQNVLKGGVGGVSGQDNTDFSKEVEFVSEEQKIEVINLDGNDSRSPTPDRDRYKRRRSSRSRSRSRDRGGGGGGRDRRRRSRSRSRSRSPRSNRRRSSRDRGNERSARDKERDREHDRERRKKGLPDIRKDHLSVCSTTLWVGHLSKLVYQEELSDTFGEYGDIVSIDQIVPRGCAFIVMNRRQDAYKAMQSLKNHKLQGRAITISWAAGKGVKSKEWKDFWDLELGVTYIPWNKLDEKTDLDSLEEGGMFDEDSMPNWMKDKINHIKRLKEKGNEPMAVIPPTSMPPPGAVGGNMLFGIDTTQPPPGPPPSMMPIVPGQFSMAPPMGGPPRMLGPPLGMPMSAPAGLSMQPNLMPGMPPPHPMMGPMGIMPPGFPIPGQVGAAPHMGLGPPGSTQFPPPPIGATAGNLAANQSASDDQMDIEMEDADEPSTNAAQQLNFNQPPPMFGNAISVPGTENGTSSANEAFSRDRNRGGPGGGGGNSRWGGRQSGGDDDPTGGDARWRDGNNGPPLMGLGGPQNFNDGRGPRGPGPMNIPPLDINNPPQRPDFMGDFENRGGGPRAAGPRGGGHNGDFFPNMQNRFNQPTSLMHMRIPPPNAFNPRMGGPGNGGGGGGPPLFMRGGQGGPGNRPQGPGGYFNPRNPFDRDVSGPPLNMRGGRGGGGRGGGRGGRGGPMGPGGPLGGSGNWSDEEIEDNFKRRAGPSGGGAVGGVAGNRFRDRATDGLEERHGRAGGGGNDRSLGGGGRRGGRGSSRERADFIERERDRDRERGDRTDRDRGDQRRRSSREERGNNKFNTNKSSQLEDTEEDWDAELKEYDTHSETTSAKNPPTQSTNTSSDNVSSEKSTAKNNEEQEQSIEQNASASPATTAACPPSVANVDSAPNTLYDEIPAPVSHVSPPTARMASPEPAFESTTTVVDSINTVAVAPIVEESVIAAPQDDVNEVVAESTMKATEAAAPAETAAVAAEETQD